MGEIRKYTSEMLMRDMGLQVGDRIKVTYGYGIEIYTITKQFENILLTNDDLKEDISDILDYDYEILPRPKRVGDLKCGEYGEHNCNSCPIRAICVSDEYNDETLYSKLELSHLYAQDQEIYDLLKARLDKEVVE